MTAPQPGPLVVKVGGSCVDDLDAPWWTDLADLAAGNQKVVVVHGWSRPLAAHCAAAGRETTILKDRYGNQSRLTTADTIADITAVSAIIRTHIAGLLAAHAIATTHVNGADGLLRAGRGERYYWSGKTLIEIDNRVGPIRSVDTDKLFPDPHAQVSIVTPLATDPDGRTVNTDGDRAAAAIAAASAAEVLTLVTNVSHLLVDGTPVTHISHEDAVILRDSNVATGGMKKKLRAADEALTGGVARVTLGSGPASALRAGVAGTSVTAAGPGLAAAPATSALAEGASAHG